MKSIHALVVGAVATVAAGVFVAPAAATPAEGDVVRTDLGQGTTTAPIWVVTAGQPITLHVQGLLLKPGAASGWHSHPGWEQSVINQGAVVVQTAANCAPVEYAAGQAVVIPAGVAHRVSNEGGVDADVVVTYTLPADAPVRDDTPAACP
ncbi:MULTISPECIES: cupin domain-containing protein [Mycolicibacterium]|uniref:Cupin n=1 Tax=Mycolicibacterium senegalense TaxID=1796 RepID=A0A378W629_9MYCO|nr:MULTISPECIES: cupin domain-containing protein [Mycolicibacterium]MCV7333672.1 cupin domain-containing protein [Mycolicibacterium senegalense]MDR7288144.1 quercetin dioxygenase-like cupin family protein [Mycolicibacterium senegalense]QZA25122.1 cupin domain-containing protein [Mycolicibacterium senegalense]CDP86027.1 cupin [Mycolicibacterium farcinogenes]SUA28279.1 cupin [Mycolicibacterium senegalense]